MKNLLEHIIKVFSLIVVLAMFTSCNLFLTTVSAFQEEPDSKSLQGPTNLPALEDIVSAPILIGPGLTNSGYPSWTWISGEKGTGVFRYKLDNSDLSSGATEDNATSFSSASNLSAGCHTFYLQEMNSDNQWSEIVSADAFIDVVSPNVISGVNRTTGVRFLTEAFANDTNGIALFNWSTASGPGSLNFSNHDALQTLITAGTTGLYSIDFSATDLAGNSNLDSLEVFFDLDAQILLPFNGDSKDESGYDRHPVKISGPFMVPDRYGNPDSAFDVENGYLQIDRNELPDLSADFTISLWFKRHISGSDDYATIIGNNGMDNFSLGLVYNPGLGFLFRVTLDGVSMLFNNPGDPSVVETDYSWHHAAVVFKKSSPNNIISLYYDSTFIRNASCSKSLNPVSSDDLIIGHGYSASSNFSGEVDDIFIYTEAKSESEIIGIFNRP